MLHSVSGDSEFLTTSEGAEKKQICQMNEDGKANSVCSTWPTQSGLDGIIEIKYKKYQISVPGATGIRFQST